MRSTTPDLPVDARTRAPLRAVLLLLPYVLLACAVPRVGDEISVAGELVHSGTRVVLWSDDRGYDAYSLEPRFPDEMTAEQRAGFQARPHYHQARGDVTATSRRELAEVVDLFVIHYDACGTSRKCFQVLHDQRALSVHFLLDLDGTLYQTLDLKERAWHGAKANDRSIGVEIAHIGAYTDPDDPRLRAWYGRDEQGLRIRFPRAADAAGLADPEFVPRPAREMLIEGPIHGVVHHQHDFTDEQYAALARLAATLSQVLPRIVLEVPRGDGGAVLDRALTDREFADFSGLLGHLHVTTRKVDPGPAFDWERLLSEARTLLADNDPDGGGVSW